MVQPESITSYLQIAYGTQAVEISKVLPMEISRIESWDLNLFEHIFVGS